MKFKEMQYTRPDVAALTEKMAETIAAFEAAPDYAAAKEAFLTWDANEREVMTASSLAHIRHSIDTRDPFYDEESKFWDETGPRLQVYTLQWSEALLASPFRDDFAREYGEQMFAEIEMAKKAFSPEILEENQKENALTTEYMKLIASAQVPFEGGIYTLSQLTPFKNDADDARRLAAWKAEGQWYKENQAELDRIYDELVHLRHTMAKKLGFENYTPMGYCRMARTCYAKEDVEKFRAAVREYLVPTADAIFRAQAERTGVAYPLSYADAALEFRSGNPKPAGGPSDILAAGKKFYRALSKETGEFFDKMLDMELLDVESTEGKQSGGYCTGIPRYSMPFIFANFNGTQHDVEVVTHEAGHAFAFYLNADRVPLSSIWPGMESAEVHSMSMEFFAWPWAEDFFGQDARKYLYSHLASALKFIPYGTLVDHFQHEVYAHPEMSPAQRHATWKELQQIYMPWIRLDGDIPFYAEGEAWQRQNHIYCNPFYYIDYCLAQTVSLVFWALIQKDREEAWKKYIAFAERGGSMHFRDLLKTAGLPSPFDEETLHAVCKTAMAYLEAYDLAGIE